MIRFAALDFLRGLGVFTALFLVFFQFLPLADGFLPWWIFLAPVFPLVSGAAITVNSLQRIHRHPWALVFRWNLWHALVLVTLGLGGKFLFTLVLPGLAPEGRYGGLFASLSGMVQGPELWFFGVSDTLTTLGTALVPFSLVLRLVFRRDVEDHFARHWTSLSLWSFGTTLVYLFLVGMDRVFWQDNLLLQWTVTGIAPFTQALAGLFTGALLGLPLVTKPRSWERAASLGVAAAPLMTVSVLQYLGFWGIAGVVPFYLSAAGVLFFSVSLAACKLAHPGPEKTRGWFRLFSRPFRSYGRLPLTVYLLAPLSLVGLMALVRFIGVEWSQVPRWGQILSALGFASAWGGLLRLWKLIAFRGSPDWLVQYVLRFTGKPSGRLLFLKEDE